MSLLKKLLGRDDDSARRFPLIEPAKNPWSLPLIDVRNITQRHAATSEDPQCASKAVSYQGDDGTGFIGHPPANATSRKCELTYRTDGRLYPGPLFLPAVMEQKWAVFFHDDTIIFVRSWLRQVHYLATVEQTAGQLTITSITGDPEAEGTDPERLVDFILRTHVIGMHYPVPLPPDADGNREEAALWCMSVFGNLANCATSFTIPFETPEKPLRSHSLLHIAVARGDEAEVRRLVGKGYPVDLLAADGLAPLHWALATKDPIPMIKLLLELGADVDVRSAAGSTALMIAVEKDHQQIVEFLTAAGADATDAEPADEQAN